MILTENQAKKILAGIGFKVPSGVVCESVDAAEMLAASLQCTRWVVKAQISAGGRATGHIKGDIQQPGGIRFANSLADVTEHADALLGSVLVTDQTGSAGAQINSVYIESYCDASCEMYLSLSVDPSAGQLVFLVSEKGGSNIEKVAASESDAIKRFAVDIGQEQLDGAAICAALGLDKHFLPVLQPCLISMKQQFLERDMLLIEINPLALDAKQTLIALDATIVFDDNALFRQGHEEQMDAYRHLPDQEFRAAVLGLNYVQLEGNIATLSAGAGLAMATVDAIVENGGAAANFLDVPPSSEVSSLTDALELLLSDSNINCLLINVFGGGIMRCDAVVDALLLVNQATEINIPVVVRLAGTNASLGLQRLRASLPQVHIADDLASAAKSCVALAADTGPKARQGPVKKSAKHLLDRWRKRKPIDTGGTV